MSTLYPGYLLRLKERFLQRSKKKHPFQMEWENKFQGMLIFMYNLYRHESTSRFCQENM